MKFLRLNLSNNELFCGLVMVFLTDTNEYGLQGGDLSVVADLVNGNIEL